MEAKTKKQAKAFMEVDPQAVALLKSAAQVALAVVGGAAAVTIAVALPGLAAVLGGRYRAEMRRVYIREMYDPLRRNGKKYEQSRKALYYLRSKGYITFNTSVADSVVQLTEKGRRYLEKVRLVTAAPRRPEKWDETWWIVLADIPTKTHKGQAELFRLKLKSMGFYPLQRTVWVHPYNPTQAINELTAYYDLGKFITLVQAVKLDSEDLAKLKKFFKL